MNQDLFGFMRPNFKKLIVWQEAMCFCDQPYMYTEELSNKKRFNLIDQPGKCAVSIPANISEGSVKRTNIHFAEFLNTALGSSYEAEPHLFIC